MAVIRDGGVTPTPKPPSNAANIGNQAISAYGNQRTVAPSAGGGIIRTPAEAQATASSGSKAKPQRDINQPPVNAQYGYTPGGFDDPTIDWQAIYDIFVAPQNMAASASPDFGGGGMGSIGNSTPEIIAPPTPAPVFQAPEVVTAPQFQQPQVISRTTEAQSGPQVQNFETFGSPSTFGGYERLRNARGPLKGASMTPEMLRRAAGARLAG